MTASEKLGQAGPTPQEALPTSSWPPTMDRLVAEHSWYAASMTCQHSATRRNWRGATHGARTAHYRIRALVYARSTIGQSLARRPNCGCGTELTVITWGPLATITPRWSPTRHPSPRGRRFRLLPPAVAISFAKRYWPSV